MLSLSRLPIIRTLLHSHGLDLLFKLLVTGLQHSAKLFFVSLPPEKPLDERLEIIGSLQGKEVYIPDLHRLFESWPESTNSQLPALRVDIDRTLEKYLPEATTELNSNISRLFPPGKRRSKLRVADPALFGAMWWPYASLERLKMGTYLSIWLFAWDDETDSLEFSSLAKDFKAASSFRLTTLARTRAYLGLDSNSSNRDLDECKIAPATWNSILEQFAPVGDEMRQHCTLEQRKLLMKQIELFIEMSQLEQAVQLGGYLPSVESYQHRRMGTSAVAVCLAIHEYTLGINLSPDVMNSPTMQSLWDSTNTIISVVNDILSIKKEVAQNQVDSLIPLLYIRHNYDIQAAVNEATRILKDAIAQFEVAASILLKDNAGDKHIRIRVEKFIESCRYACTANLNWSLRSGRYKLNVESLHNGITMTI